MSMQKSGRWPVIPKTVVLRYFSCPARSMNVTTYSEHPTAVIVYMNNQSMLIIDNAANWWRKLASAVQHQSMMKCSLLEGSVEIITYSKY